MRSCAHTAASCTGKYFHRLVTYTLPGGNFGVEADHVVMGLSTMRDTQIIDLQPIVSAPTDGRCFDAIIDNAPNRLEIVRFDAGRWHIYRGDVPSPTPNAPRPMTVWQHLPEDVYPTHWVRGSERHDASQSEGLQKAAD